MCRALAISRKCARRTEQAVLWRSVHTACADTDSQSRTVTHFTGGKTETQSCRVAEPGTGPEEFGRGTTCALPQHLAGSAHRLREVGNTVPLCRSVCRGSGHPELRPKPPGQHRTETRQLLALPTSVQPSPVGEMDFEQTVLGWLGHYSHSQCFAGEGQGGAQSAQSRVTWAGLGTEEAGWVQGPAWAAQGDVS